MQNLGQYLELASALYNSVLELELPYRRAYEAGDSMKYLFCSHHFFESQFCYIKYLIFVQSLE